MIACVRDKNAKVMVGDLLALEEDKRILAACTLWRSWTRRNKINAKEKAWSLTELMSQIKYWSSESKLFCQKNVASTTNREIQHWSAPADGSIKFNTDGDFYQDTRKGGWGFIARDSTGAVRGAGAGHLVAVASAAQAEAIASMEALNAASEWGMAQVTIETDASNLVRAVETTEYDRAPEGVLYRDIRSFIRLNFNSVKFLYCPRTCNKVTHALGAIGASQYESSRLWLDSVPDSVSVLVAGDCAELLN